MKQQLTTLSQNFCKLASRVVQKISNAFKPLAAAATTAKHSFAREASPARATFAKIAPAVATMTGPKANALTM